MAYQPHLSENTWPTKAYKNDAFLNSAAARLVRVQCELLEPEQRFREQGVHNTIVFFGSARIRPEADARADLQRARADLDTATDEPTRSELEGRLRLAERNARAATYYTRAVELARELTAWSLANHSEVHQRYHICSGGGPGIMQAANQGACEAGGKSIGLGISLPFEQHSNPHISDELDFEFHYFFVRKYWFLYPAKALVVFPGGFGTMDELFEMLTLVQTGKIRKHLPMVLFGSDFWNRLLNWDVFLEWGVISEKDLALFHVCDDVAEARDHVIGAIEQNGNGSANSAPLPLDEKQ
jgi:uncharacterized protein (TIGR00730 family)